MLDNWIPLTCYLWVVLLNSKFKLGWQEVVYEVGFCKKLEIEGNCLYPKSNKKEPPTFAVIIIIKKLRFSTIVE
jgi:hypothetical protein